MTSGTATCTLEKHGIASEVSSSKWGHTTDVTLSVMHGTPSSAVLSVKSSAGGFILVDLDAPACRHLAGLLLTKADELEAI